MQKEFQSPFGGPAPSERHLLLSPLASVITQVRFSSVLTLLTQEGLIPFQERVRKTYPLFEPVTTSGFQLGIGAEGPSLQPVSGQVWKMSDPTGAYIVTLAADAITLETKRYPGRKAFLERWAQLLHWLAETYEPALAVRAGVRYTNRIEDDGSADISLCLNPSLTGFGSASFSEILQQSISEASVKVGEGQMVMRWGIVPPNVTFIPDILPAGATKSWLIDIDVFNEDTIAFDANQLALCAETLAERAYAVFRWSVTDAGLRHFGAEA
jgi:uncharacterized protein (TIGR04255 family)